MKVGIHKASYGRFPLFLQRYESILTHNELEHVRLDASDEAFWARLIDLDLFIYRWQHFHDDSQMAKTILPIVENEIGIKCFPNINTCWHYDDKIRQYYLLTQHGFPMIKSWIFWNRTAAIRWLEKSASFPLVFKLKGGAGSTNVILLKDIGSARKLVKIMFSCGVKSGRIPAHTAVRWKDYNVYRALRRLGGNIFRAFRGEDINPYWQINKNYIYFQEFLPNNDYDTRVTVIGNRAFAFRRMNRKNDFRSSGSGIISYDMDKIDLLFIETAFRVSNKLGFQSMAYDFMYDVNGKARFCEISYDFLDTTVFQCPGYWDADLNWHAGNFWPQFCQLSDALERPDLRQPQIDYQLPNGLIIV